MASIRFDDDSFLDKLKAGINDPTSEFYVKPDEFEYEHVKGFKFALKKIYGQLIGNTCINASNLKSLRFRADDVLLVGYPKSGWLSKWSH